jgi:hypothetical protein
MSCKNYQPGPPPLAHPTSKSTDHSWDTEIKMYAGVIGSGRHTTFRHGLTIAVVHSGFKPDKACLRGVEKMRPVTLSCPFRLHHTFLLLRPARYYPRFRIWHPSSGR